MIQYVRRGNLNGKANKQGIKETSGKEAASKKDSAESKTNSASERKDKEIKVKVANIAGTFINLDYIPCI